jgi:L-rhamnose isomerase/sugar isomerase
MVDRKALTAAQEANDVVAAQEILQDAFRNDMRPLVAEARLRKSAALDPLEYYRKMNIRQSLVRERGTNTVATGL